MDQNTCDKIQRDVESISINAIKGLENQIKGYLDKCGVFYKLFSRIKSATSTIEKMTDRERRGIHEYIMQDLVGMRLVLYFKSDIPLCEKLIGQHFDIKNISKDKEEEDKFRPQRINYVCALPTEIVNNFDSAVWDNHIDRTFEIQIRTIFSEGWHEIEHDFRYKCLEDWKDNNDLSRTLNGIFATLENCDWTISSLLTQVAYRHYKAGEWIPMLKNTFRIRIVDCDGMEDILQYFDEHKDVAKCFYRLDREDFLIWISDLSMSIPLKLKNLVMLANIYAIHDEKILELTPQIIKDIAIE